jgi:exo-beta-1,3-glucanase (GH17 family)
MSLFITSQAHKPENWFNGRRRSCYSSILPDCSSIMLRFLSLLALVVITIVSTWYGLGRPVSLPPSPLGPGGKLTCISYAPFHGEQAPFAPYLRIPDRQIRQDLQRLSALTSCVRTYSAMGPQGRITTLAGKYGLEVMQGIWLGRDRAENSLEIEAALKLAHRHPGTVKALIVGNETLLRGELPANEIKAYVEEVGRRSDLPVTYADVWEFWLKTPQLASAVDFVAIHILPYWEDDPVSEPDAVAHVREVRARLMAAFPGKEIWIGEIGWPSKGRMREGALPSPLNQARFLSDVVRAAETENFGVNVVEAFDQPWKRLLEGTVGGYWGLHDDGSQEPKFRFGDKVSNHPDWWRKASLGIGLAVLVFLSFLFGARGSQCSRAWPLDLACAAIALASGLLFGLAAINLPLEGEIAGDRLRALGMFVLALVVPLAASYALGHGAQLGTVATALAPSFRRHSDSIAVVLAALLVASVVAAIHVALGLVFDPRYKDFPFALLTGPVLALCILAFTGNKASPRPGSAEMVAAIVLTGSACFIIANEGTANWQALLFGSLLVLLALTVLTTRAAPG